MFEPESSMSSPSISTSSFISRVVPLRSDIDPSIERLPLLSRLATVVPLADAESIF